MRKSKYIDANTIEGLEDHLIKLNRVTKVVKGGRTFSFSALVVVGNRKGIVGLGYGKAKEIPEAIRKASEEAKRKLHKIHLQGETIPFQVQAKFCSSTVKLFPASEGTGVIAGVNIRSVLEYAGVHNLLSKTYGSRNTINASRAVLKALISLKDPVEMAKSRNLSLKQFYN